MKTVYCAGCFVVLKRFFEKAVGCEVLLAGVCESCQRALKVELDRARALLHDQQQKDSTRMGERMDSARRVLWEKGVR